MKTNKKIKDGVSITGIVTILVHKAGTKELVQKIVQKNMIMQGTSTGKDLIVQRLIGTNTYTLNVTYGAIGTGSTAAAQSDTQLVAESARTTLALGQNVGNNTARLQFFFPDSVLTNTTYREFGTFVDGSSIANSGKLFNRALFSTAYVKTSGNDTTVQVEILLT